MIAGAYLIKGVAGMGGPLLAVPFIASIASVELAVVVLSLGNLVSNGWLLWEHRSGAKGTGLRDDPVSRSSASRRRSRAPGSSPRWTIGSCR